MPFFSVIIPLYNKENFIEATLKSVLNQSFNDFEVIIINDGSTDESEQKVLRFDDSRIKYFYTQNKGVSAARNYGISIAKADFIAFIDADDYWYPNFLEEIFQNINRFPNQKIFSAAFEIETPKKNIPALYSIEKTNDYQIVNYFDASFKESVIWTSSAVFHKTVFEEIGNFDVTIKSGQDTDLWIRIGLVHSILFSWKILARYVYVKNSLSKSNDYLSSKMNFDKFKESEKENSKLKKFLDLNRFSLAIKCKLIKDKKNYILFAKGIDPINLSLKRRILLQLPSSILIRLLKLNLFLVRIGVNNSVFK